MRRVVVLILPSFVDIATLGPEITNEDWMKQRLAGSIQPRAGQHMLLEIPNLSEGEVDMLQAAFKLGSRPFVSPPGTPELSLKEILQIVIATILKQKNTPYSRGQ